MNIDVKILNKMLAKNIKSYLKESYIWSSKIYSVL